MDPYSTEYLSRVLRNLRRPPTFFLDTFFPEIERSDAEVIYFDVSDERPMMTPFCSPVHAGTVVQNEGYTTKSFKPAYAKDKRTIDPEAPLRRVAGETIGGDMAPVNRERAHIAQTMQRQTRALTRRLEYMAALALRDGAITVKGENYQTTNIDFGRDSSLTMTLSSGSQWGDSGVKPLEDVEDWCLSAASLSGTQISDVVMGPAAWRRFRESADVQRILDARRGDLPATMQTVLESADNAVQYMGTDGTRRYWVYSATVYSPEDDQEVSVLGDNQVVGVSRGVEGVRHFGAIRDPKAGYQTAEYWPKSWITDDPAMRYVMLQSAPLMVPYRPNASFRVTVA